VLREGSGEPLLLYHGVMGSASMWRDVIPLLTADYDVIAPNALGHRGGPTPSERPTPYRDVVDAAERQLDSLSIGKAHLVGNSMGGWMALELARRDRALSVCAISPAGMWTPGGARNSVRTRRLRSGLRMGRAARPILPFAYRSRLVRRFALSNVSADGGRVSRIDALTLTDDMLGCTIAEDLLGTDQHFAPLDPLPCPVAVVWCERDRVFPEREFSVLVHERLPAASYEVLPAVGHVPMLDAPGLVAQTICAAIAETTTA